MSRPEDTGRQAAWETELSEQIELKIYRLSVACIVFVAISFIVPRFVPNSEGGFAAAATAALTFFIMLGATLVLSLYLAVLTFRNYGGLGRTARVAGISPSVLLAAALVGLVVFLRF